MLYRFIVKPIEIEAPTEEEAWDELFHNYDLDPDDIEINVECIGERE